jgi:beta-glucosidase
MPGPTRWRGAALAHAVSSNKVKISELDARVREVLNLIKTAGKSGVPENAPEKELDRPEDRKLLREVAANAAVLLKNDVGILPFKKDKKIAVIGPNSKITTYCGGGSASLNAYRAVTPFDGISAQAQDGVEFAQGAYGHKMLPQLGKDLVTSDGKKGFTVRTFNDPPSVTDRKPLEERHLSDANIFFVDYTHANLNTIWYAETEGIFTPTESGLYDFGLAVTGTAQLFLDGKLLIDNAKNQRPGSSFLGTGTVEEMGHKELKSGHSYRITVQWGCAKTSTLRRAGTVDFGHGGVRFSGCKRIETKTSIQEAADLAASVDQVIIFAGLSGEWESEGEDRENMDLPPGTDDLISHVLDANPNTVVVIQSGTPVAMPWIKKAKVIVQAWYGGNETGHGIADVIYGNVNPSGKLPLTFPKRVKDNPTYLNYRSEGGRVLYGEDVYVGYRYYEELEIDPQFAFGHGLSYTTFALSDLSLRQKKDDELSIHCKLENTGDREGAEVVQVYVAPVSPPIKRPVKELKGFMKKVVKSGESADVVIDVDIVRATSFWDEKESRWCSSAGEYKILVGTSSIGDFLETSLRLQKTKYWNGL